MTNSSSYSACLIPENLLSFGSGNFFTLPGALTLGLVIAAAMVVNLVVAGMSGILVPVMLERAGVDPALASGTFVTTVTDVVGFFVFLGLAAVVLL